MEIPKHIIDEIKRTKNEIDTESYKKALAEAERFYSKNKAAIEEYIKFQNTIETVNPIEKEIIQEALKYIKSNIPDVMISNAHHTSVQSVIQNIDIPMNSVNSSVAIKKLIPSLTFKEISDFINFLSEYPMLGYKNECGQKIYGFIEQAKRTVVKNVTLYRIRKGEYGKKTPYTTREMIGPPYGISKQNRFNSIGIGVSYYSDSLLYEEVSLSENDPYTTIKVELTDSYRMLDIRSVDTPLYNLCHDRADKKNDVYNKQYLLPNYITDCAKNAGFEGIVYRSLVNDKATNYAFFDIAITRIKVIDKLDYKWADV